MEHAEGYVEEIIFKNDENGYKVFVLNTPEGELTCTGNVPYIHGGEYIDVDGSYVNHPVYGRQMKVQGVSYKEPTDEKSILIYLSEGAVKGVRKALAQRIVKEFGKDSLDVMEKHPEALASIKGISLKKAREISAQMTAGRREREAVMFLQKYGLGIGVSMRIYEQYGDSIYHIIKNDPYQLSSEVRGIGFKRADEIASRIGIVKDSEFRIKS